jgi:alpha-D-xyloside xylohydrolase
MDIGGFSVPDRYNTKTPTPADLEDWRELNTRWFQFGTFVPLMRVHGEKPFREMWFFGAEEDHPAFRTQLKFDRLRYRLLPYIYSLAGAVTLDGGSFMRPLVMDFQNDPRAAAIGDQYLFGPSLLVCPVTKPQARSRPVYLPAVPGGWYDFWKGAAVTGGQTIEAPAPYEAIPLYVRAGAILPFGPDEQFATEKPADPITLRIYAGADGAFKLYEDDGLTYGYEKGQCARIPLIWNNTAHTLTIGARLGGFPGMLAERTFRIVLVTPASPSGYDNEPTEPRIMHYTGQSLSVKL